jgi:16S rRNA (uracil1498-N3)-methyltransferase
MRRFRVHVDAALQPGRSVLLPPFAAEHLTRVLRLGDGAAVTCFNGDGQDYFGHLRLRGREALFEAERIDPPAAPESPLKVTLAQCIARGEKMDAILQKAVELGVAAIAPLVSERTEVKLDEERADKRLAHWRKVLHSACEQCGRAVVPALAAPRKLVDWAAECAAGDAAGTLRLVLAPGAGTRIADLSPPAGEVAVVVGPEGGLSERDLAALELAGFTRLALGPRILRTETAGPAALAALQLRFGDF